MIRDLACYLLGKPTRAEIDEIVFKAIRELEPDATLAFLRENTGLKYWTVSFSLDRLLDDGKVQLKKSQCRNCGTVSFRYFGAIGF